MHSLAYFRQEKVILISYFNALYFVLFEFAINLAMGVLGTFLLTFGKMHVFYDLCLVF